MKSTNDIKLINTLHQAAHQNIDKKVKKLIVAGVSPTQKDKHGQSVLGIASGHQNFSLLIWLLGCDVQWEKKELETVNFLAAKHNKIKLFEKLYDYLIRLGRSINVEKSFGSDPINATHYAVYAQSLPMLQLLYKGGAKFNQKSVAFGTPLQLAVSRHSESIVEFLLKHSRPINCKDLAKALFGAVKAAFKYPKNRDQALGIADRLLDYMQDYRLDLSSLFVQKGWTVLSLALELGAFDLFKKMLKMRPNVYQDTHHLAEMAYKQGQSEIAQALVEYYPIQHPVCVQLYFKKFLLAQDYNDLQSDGLPQYLHQLKSCLEVMKDLQINPQYDLESIEAMLSWIDADLKTYLVLHQRCGLSFSSLQEAICHYQSQLKQKEFGGGVAQALARHPQDVIQTYQNIIKAQSCLLGAQPVNDKKPLESPLALLPMELRFKICKDVESSFDSEIDAINRLPYKVSRLKKLKTFIQNKRPKF